MADYRAQTWQYATHDRIVGLSGSWGSPEEAMEALREHTKADLTFTEGRVGMEIYAALVHDRGLDMAVVYRVSNAEIVASAHMVE